MSVKRTKKSHALVALQMCAIAGCIYAPDLKYQGDSLYLLISMTGGLLALWVLYHNRPGNFDIYPEPRKATQLITTGPYQWVRHPMYSSLLLLMLGISLYSYQFSNALAFSVLMLVVYGKARLEEQYLQQQFAEYKTYQQHTKRFIPFVL